MHRILALGLVLGLPLDPAAIAAGRASERDFRQSAVPAQHFLGQALAARAGLALAFREKRSRPAARLVRLAGDAARGTVAGSDFYETFEGLLRTQGYLSNPNSGSLTVIRSAFRGSLLIIFPIDAPAWVAAGIRRGVAKVAFGNEEVEALGRQVEWLHGLGPELRPLFPRNLFVHHGPERAWMVHAMEWIDGQNAADLLWDGQADPERVLQVWSTAFEAFVEHAPTFPVPPDWERTRWVGRAILRIQELCSASALFGSIASEKWIRIDGRPYLNLPLALARIESLWAMDTAHLLRPPELAQAHLDLAVENLIPGAQGGKVIDPHTDGIGDRLYDLGQIVNSMDFWFVLKAALTAEKDAGFPAPAFRLHEPGSWAVPKRSYGSFLEAIDAMLSTRAGYFQQTFGEEWRLRLWYEYVMLLVWMPCTLMGTSLPERAERSVTAYCLAVIYANRFLRLYASRLEKKGIAVRQELIDDLPPESLAIDQPIAGQILSNQRPPFPMLGSLPPGAQPRQPDAAVRAAWENLAQFLIVNDPLPPAADAMIVFGADLLEVPRAAAALALRIPIRLAVPSGGVGRLTPKEWKNEAERFAQEMALIAPALRIIPEPRSTNTRENGELAWRIIQETLGPVKSLLGVHFPLQSRRTQRVLVRILEKSGLPRSEWPELHFVSIFPMALDRPLAGWPAALWAQRWLFESVGELGGLIGLQAPDWDVLARTLIPAALLEEALRVSDHLLQDNSIPQAEVQKIRFWESIFRRHLSDPPSWSPVVRHLFLVMALALGGPCPIAPGR